MDYLFVPDDGYTCRKQIAAVPGLHPRAEVEYRPALAAERNAYFVRRQGAAVERQTIIDCELIGKHVLRVNGEALPKDKLERLNPALFSQFIDLVLSYSPADEVADAKNSSSG